MMAISYTADGQISIYRNGAAYASYNGGSTGPITYTGGIADVVLGIREQANTYTTGTATGYDPYLAGSIDEARIYNQAFEHRSD